MWFDNTDPVSQGKCWEPRSGPEFSTWHGNFRREAVFRRVANRSVAGGIDGSNGRQTSSPMSGDGHACLAGQPGIQWHRHLYVLSDSRFSKPGCASCRLGLGRRRCRTKPRRAGCCGRRRRHLRIQAEPLVAWSGFRQGRTLAGSRPGSEIRDFAYSRPRSVRRWHAIPSKLSRSKRPSDWPAASSNSGAFRLSHACTGPGFSMEKRRSNRPTRPFTSACGGNGFQSSRRTR